ncbi:hypothetical protein Agub_g12490 [Astrephomene gubernaculifera]|uniref:Sugar phosphate transporter domain-containing protein n=1 Tax=Astrephomene gubernaculifera TaxID=47775 RepID=A0AAD3HRU3_9CHLO|nr:hypothetical protein Agub_g12490 [Astrephomene gubernaculifera]
MWLSLLVAVLYGFVAVAANFVNKYAVQVLPLPSAILLIQTCTTVVVLRSLSALRLIRPLPPLRSLPRQPLLAPLAACYCLHAVLVLYSLAFLSVPMYNTLKRLTPVMVLAAKACVDRSLPDGATSGSVLLIVGGCLVAGAGDLDFDGQGYVLALLCALAQAAYMLLTEKAGGSSSSAPNTSSGGSGKRHPQHHYHGSGADLPDIESKAVSSSATAYGSGGGGFGGGLVQCKHKASFGSGPGSHRGVAVEVLAHGRGDASQTQLGLLELGSSGGGGGGSKDKLGERHGESGGDPVSSSASYTGVMTSGAMQASCSDIGGGTTGSGGGGSQLPSPSPPTAAPLSATELLYAICVTCVPAMFAVCLVTGEGARAPGLLAALRVRMGAAPFTGWLAMTAVTEGLLTGSIILCTQLNSALTTSIVGVLKGAVSSLLGFFLLGGVRFQPVNVAGIVMNMAGGVWYSAVQYVRQGKSGG